MKRHVHSLLNYGIIQICVNVSQYSNGSSGYNIVFLQKIINKGYRLGVLAPTISQPDDMPICREKNKNWQNKNGLKSDPNGCKPHPSEYKSMHMYINQRK